MFPAKSLLTLLTVFLSATVCLAEDDPSFPQPAKGVELVKDQYIVQFKADDFEQAKNSILKDEKVIVVRYIDTRNIGVFNFSSQQAAAKWRDGAVGVKYFEEGEKCVVYAFTQNTRSPPLNMICIMLALRNWPGQWGGGHFFLEFGRLCSI
jgi:hypothetical protein